MQATRSSILAALFFICACQSPDRGTLSPLRVFEISPDLDVQAARHLTVDYDGNMYIFDYDDYVIRKFDPSGTLLTEFGGTGDEPGLFQHLMAVKVSGDSLFALDTGSLSVFDLSGELRSHRGYTESVTCDYPAIRPDGRWAAEWYIEETAEYALTYRNTNGSERGRIAAYELGDVYPGIQAGDMFFVNRTQAPTFLYDFLADGRLIWMNSDDMRVYVHDTGGDDLLYQSSLTHVPYPVEEISAMRERQVGLSPPLFMNVPEHYQIAHQLIVDGSGDIWIYVMSTERTGFLRLSPAGRETGFYTMETDFNVRSSRISIANGRMYFMDTDGDETRIFFVDLQ